ncbi:hypothetical protein [Pseudalkalibacillus sp. SCS-8]|uniref:hypothetical protein n=1 Tax=Pseudalkalibacillus nanhaiensis TaxID=3115291 RepID=UPI0032DBBA4D
MEAKETDAVFIMPEHLKEAAGHRFAEVYNSLKIPIFFIGSEKHLVAFTSGGLSYEDAYDLENNEYAFGNLSTENGEKRIWEFGLYNDEETKAHVQRVYTRIFKAVEEIKIGKEG